MNRVIHLATTIPAASVIVAVLLLNGPLTEPAWAAADNSQTSKVEYHIYHVFGSGKKPGGEAVKDLPSKLKPFVADFKRMPFSKIEFSGDKAVKFSGKKPFEAKIPKGLGQLRIQRDAGGNLTVTIYTKDKKKLVFKTPKTVILSSSLSAPKLGEYLLVISVKKKTKKK